MFTSFDIPTCSGTVSCYIDLYSNIYIYVYICFPCSRRFPHFWVDQTPINCLNNLHFQWLQKPYVFPKKPTHKFPWVHGESHAQSPQSSRGGHTLSLSLCSAHLSSVAGMAGIQLGSRGFAMDFQELNGLNGSWKDPQNDDVMDLGDSHGLQCCKNGGIFNFNIFQQTSVGPMFEVWHWNTALGLLQKFVH